MNSLTIKNQPRIHKLELKKDKGNGYVFSWKSKRAYTSKFKIY